MADQFSYNVLTDFHYLELEELHDQLKSLPVEDDELLNSLYQSINCVSELNITGFINQTRLAMTHIVYPVYSRVIENPLNKDSKLFAQMSKELKTVILSRPEDWEEFVYIYHLIECYLDWIVYSGEPKPENILKLEDTIIALRITIRMLRWYLEDFQKSDRFKKIREGRKQRFHIQRSLR